VIRSIQNFELFFSSVFDCSFLRFLSVHMKGCMSGSPFFGGRLRVCFIFFFSKIFVVFRIQLRKVAQTACQGWCAAQSRVRNRMRGCKR